MSPGTAREHARPPREVNRAYVPPTDIVSDSRSRRPPSTPASARPRRLIQHQHQVRHQRVHGTGYYPSPSSVWANDYFANARAPAAPTSPSTAGAAPWRSVRIPRSTTAQQDLLLFGLRGIHDSRAQNGTPRRAHLEMNRETSRAAGLGPTIRSTTPSPHRRTQRPHRPNPSPQHHPQSRSIRSAKVEYCPDPFPRQRGSHNNFQQAGGEIAKYYTYTVASTEHRTIRALLPRSVYRRDISYKTLQERHGHPLPVPVRSAVIDAFFTVTPTTTSRPLRLHRFIATGL